jgi:hypothetical protein
MDMVYFPEHEQVKIPKLITFLLFLENCVHYQTRFFQIKNASCKYCSCVNFFVRRFFPIGIAIIVDRGRS